VIARSDLSLLYVFTVPPDAKKIGKRFVISEYEKITARCSPGPPKGTRGATQTLVAILG
jgi:hypothetical protein